MFPPLAISLSPPCPPTRLPFARPSLSPIRTPSPPAVRELQPAERPTEVGIGDCDDCSGAHRGLGVRLSFVRSVAADASWPGPYFRLMASNPGSNGALDAFLTARGVPSRTAISCKYSSLATALFSSCLHALAHRRPFHGPFPQTPPMPLPYPHRSITPTAPHGSRSPASITATVATATHRSHSPSVHNAHGRRSGSPSVHHAHRRHSRSPSVHHGHGSRSRSPSVHHTRGRPWLPFPLHP